MTRNSNELLARIQSLPVQGAPTFGIDVRKCLHELDPTSEELLQIVDSPAEPIANRFAAFYAVQVRCRRRYDYSEYREHVDRYQTTFADQPMFDFMLAEYYSSPGSDRSNLEAALQYACEAERRNPHVAGIKTLRAAITADLADICAVSADDLLLAERSARQAVALTDGLYAKHFAILAHVLAWRGQYDEARRSIATAIEREDSNGKDYIFRLGEYQLIRSRITSIQQSEETRKQQLLATAEYREVRRETLTLVGLLAAVVAFLTTAVNLSSRFPPLQAATLLIVDSGALSAVFTIAFMLIGNVRWTRITCGAAASLALIVGGLLLSEQLASG